MGKLIKLNINEYEMEIFMIIGITIKITVSEFVLSTALQDHIKYSTSIKLNMVVYYSFISIKWIILIYKMYLYNLIFIITQILKANIIDVMIIRYFN